METNTTAGKKLLILAGVAQHVKLVRAARELGVYTIVTDYLEPDASPAKKEADEYWMLSYGDTDKLEALCREKRVDGVLTCYHESSQIPYYRLCRRLGLPCYADLNQFETLTNKRLFKELCSAHGVGVIPEYSEEEALSGKLRYPVMVKPADRCGSHGLAVCGSPEELRPAIEAAKRESLNGDVIIEEYIAGKNSFQVTYLFENGKAHLIRTADGYKGTVEQELDRVALCSISPSVYTAEYLSTANDAFVEMLRSIGAENGPVMAQGFYDDGVFRFYDPGRRFPGTDFEETYKEIFGVDLLKMMVMFALSGKMPSVPIDDESVFLRGNQVVVLFPTLKTGTIGRIAGLDALEEDPRISRVQQKHTEGTLLKQPNTVSQRICEVDFTAHSIGEAKELIREIQGTLAVSDSNGEDMIDSPFDADRIVDPAAISRELVSET